MSEENVLFATEADVAAAAAKDAAAEAQTDKYLICISDQLLYGIDAEQVVEIITEVRCRDSPKMQIGASKYPMDFVRGRMGALTYEHVSYVLDNLGKSGPVRNPHRYLLALLFNAPASSNVAVQAVFNANNG